MPVCENSSWASRVWVVVGLTFVILWGNASHAQLLVRQTNTPLDEARGASVPEANSLRLSHRLQPSPQKARPVEQSLLPFGSNLFDGGFQGEREDGLNPDYTVQPGDRITLRLWGATDFSGAVVVDTQGNIFIPEIGPIQVKGVKNSRLNQRIASAIKTVFTSNVNVYTNLEGTNPVLVYITGFVQRPGAYAGVASDSILFFLSRAGGIDKARGSFRDISVRRGGKEIASSDLYQFLISGILARPQFIDGDTIIVREKGAVVRAYGEVRNAFEFEIPKQGVAGNKLLAMVRPEATVSHVTLTGIRGDSPVSKYLNIQDFSKMTLFDGDEVIFEEDRHTPTITVRIEGSHLGPSRFSVPRGTTLLELLKYVEVDPALAAVNAIQIRRESVRVRQKQALEDSLRRLETTVLGASSATDAEAKIRVQEAQLISQFVARAREVEPRGVLVVAHDGELADIKLQNDDIVSIPERSNVVLVSGEVMVPQALVLRDGDTYQSYIDRVGGYSDRADESRALIIRQNGEVILHNGAPVLPGDEIMVLPKVPVKNLQMVATISQIIFQIALAAATVAGL